MSEQPPVPATDVQVAFLDLVAQGLSRTALADVGRDRAWLREQLADEAFALAYHDAREAAVDAAEEELYRRGVTGSQEPVLLHGQPVYKRDPDTGEVMLDDDFEPIPLTVPRKSDDLLKFYLQGRRAEFRSGGGAGGLTIGGPGGPGGGKVKVEIEFVDPPEWGTWDEETGTVIRDVTPAEGA